MNIQLNFINHSNDFGNNQVVIFQKNSAQGQHENHIAWRVIQNSATDDTHPFSFPLQATIGATDAYGNSTASLTADNGDAFAVKQSKSGYAITAAGKAKVATEIEVVNGLAKGTVNINCYRDGKLIALCNNLVPRQLAAFEFKPTFYIGVTRNITEGTIMNAAVVSEIYTEINLMGIASADIVMTGGGTGADATPFTFTLTNVTYA